MLEIPCPCQTVEREDGSTACRRCWGDWYACDCERHHAPLCLEPARDLLATFDGQAMLTLLGQIADLILDLEFDQGIEIIQGGPWDADCDQYRLAAVTVDKSRANLAYEMAVYGVIGCEQARVNRIMPAWAAWCDDCKEHHSTCQCPTF